MERDYLGTGRTRKLCPRRTSQGDRLREQSLVWTALGVWKFLKGMQVLLIADQRQLDLGYRHQMIE